MSKARFPTTIKSAIAMGVMVLLLAGCGQASITSGAPQSLRDSEAGEVVVDFFQNDDQVGKLYIQTQTAESDLVRFFLEVPLSVPDLGQADDGTVLFGFLAGREVFAGNGFRLHAELEFGAGDAVADLVIVPAS